MQTEKISVFKSLEELSESLKTTTPKNKRLTDHDPDLHVSSIVHISTTTDVRYTCANEANKVTKLLANASKDQRYFFACLSDSQENAQYLVPNSAWVEKLLALLPKHIDEVAKEQMAATDWGPYSQSLEPLLKKMESLL